MPKASIDAPLQGVQTGRKQPSPPLMAAVHQTLNGRGRQDVHFPRPKERAQSQRAHQQRCPQQIPIIDLQRSPPQNTP
eukprot:3529400-Lingulodinium_polyedra.AAC.1